MVLKLLRPFLPCGASFENDVKMYGTQAERQVRGLARVFENDVKMYGTQAQNIFFQNNVAV